MSWTHRRLVRRFSYPIKIHSQKKDRINKLTLKINKYIDQFLNKKKGDSKNIPKKPS